MPPGLPANHLSFVIPVLNEQEVIVPLLKDLRARYPGSELIVVDGGSTDQSAALARPLCEQLLSAPADRALQMNAGGQSASGEYVLFLHADTLPQITSGRLLDYLAKMPQWGFCRVQLSGTSRVFRVIEWFMNQRSRITQVATGDQMIFVRKSVFEQTAGFDAIPLMEDVAYCKRLRQLAPPLVIAEPVATSSRRWEVHGVVPTVVRMWLLRLAYFIGVSPGTLARHYYGR